jgi:hypothetical protein
MKKWAAWQIEVWISSICVCSLLGCGGESGSGGSDATAGFTGTGTAGTQAIAGGLSFERDIQPKINEACSCHQSSPILMAPFSLKVGEAYDALVGTPSIQLPAMVRVEPGSLNESYLWHKINGTQAEVGGSGLIMPSNIPLTQDERDLFGKWIAGGAGR